MEPPKDDLCSAALKLAGDDAELRELIRRCVDDGDAGACAELDRRGLEPPVVPAGPPPIELAR